MKNIKPVVISLQRSVYSYGCKAVAMELGHSEQYLGRICNPEPDPEEARHIQLRTFAAILGTTQDLRPLEALADLFDKRLVNKSRVQPDAPTMYEEFNQDHKKLVEYHEIGKRFRRGEVTEQELKEAKQAAIDDIEETFVRVHEGDEVVEGHMYRLGESKSVKAVVKQ